MFSSGVVEGPPVAVEEMLSRSARLGRVEGEIARVCGMLNVLHAELVALIGEAMELGAAEGHGLRSAGHWVAWRTGSSSGHGAALARLAEQGHDR